MTDIFLFFFSESTKEPTILKMAAQQTKNNENEQQNGKESSALAYMHNPPRIMPNYGKKRRSTLPKSNISRVLLYDNATQQEHLEVKLSHIKLEQNRVRRILDLHKRSFLCRQKKRQQNMADSNITLPDIHHNSKEYRILSGLSSEYTQQKIQQKEETYAPRTKSAFSVSDLEVLKLPELQTNGKHVIFKLKEANGQTQIFHTFDNDGIFSEFVPLHSFYDKASDDPRFQGLQNSLAKIDISSDGLNELSPSDRSPRGTKSVSILPAVKTIPPDVEDDSHINEVDIVSPASN